MSDDYAVGYGRPPQATRFKAGQSGNPKGRPKGSHNLFTLLNDAMQTRVPVTINGRRVYLTKAEVAIRQQVDNAAKGDLRALAFLVKAMAQAVPPPSGSSADQKTELTTEQCNAIFEALVREHAAEGGL
jgi:hypothetical protein